MLNQDKELLEKENQILNEDEELLEKTNQIMEEAIDKSSQLIALNPAVAEIILKQCLNCDPEHNQALQLLGLCKHRMGKNSEAIEIIQTALEIDPKSSENWNNLGLAYGGLGNKTKSIECIKKALEIDPENFLYYNNMALQYRSLGDYENAIKNMEKAISINENTQLWVNLGGIYGELLNLEESERCVRNALKLDPENAGAYVDLSFIYHLRGDWKTGFAAQEWRVFYYQQFKYYHNTYDVEKLWDGKADLNGKKVLVYGEQGMGDIIQFLRYAKFLKEKGAYVIIHCPTNLNSIVSRIEGVDETTNRDIFSENDETFPDYDYQFCLMSAPYLLDVQKITGEPYIKPVTYNFKDYIKSSYGDTFNIGIAWAGNPAHPQDKERSIPLKNFKKIHDIPGVKLFSLQLDSSKRQYGFSYRLTENSMELKEKTSNFQKNISEKFFSKNEIVDYSEGCEDMKIVDLTKMIESYEDTATILVGLDLVICCDTSIVHLAGAMGVPVWAAIPYNPDWRWQLKGDTTHWYDSVRLFRKTERNEWGPIFEKIHEELNEFILQNKR
jgi:tetratricopeptide (TPR) repeat protein